MAADGVKDTCLHLVYLLLVCDEGFWLEWFLKWQPLLAPHRYFETEPWCCSVEVLLESVAMRHRCTAELTAALSLLGQRRTLK
jgi:hypothetical protein